MIQLDQVSKHYPPPKRGGAAVTALDDVSLTIGAGEIYGIIGRSGAGKSTLIRVINQLEKPTAGRVLVDGVEISSLSGSALRRERRGIGMIFQHFNLLSSRSVFDNVALPLELAGVSKDGIKAKVEPLLELVGLSDKRDRYPAELSGGQKQRVGIARALATEPKVLLCDEATSALDPETTRDVLRLIAEINRKLGLTVVLITHEMHVIKEICHKVAVLEAGRVIERGSVFEVFTRPQHPTTRAFIGMVTGIDLPPDIANQLRADPQHGGEAVLLVRFTGDSAGQPILSRLARHHGIDANILSGRIDHIQGRPFGTLVISLPNGETLGNALAFFQSHQLSVEVLGHVAPALLAAG
ncbi:MAG: methionine ABC transporter ATP-binding protein [Oceanibaculum nanhaiense]|jgi:D-methionine transport system ATP-binding protein|uniref:methionine ABC transporter ATP-binding protein n=1 Tax=Oceanibaculum nanhaiense TaxID=1909734 RepID=UPI0032EE5F11